MLLTNLRDLQMMSKKVALCLLALMTPLPALADTVTVGGTGAGLSTIRVLGAAATDVWPDMKIEVLPSLGSTGGIRALQDGHLDLAITSRALTDAERQSGVREIHLADTPIAFVSSHRGDLDLSTDDIVAMFSATCSVWPDGTPVRIVLRPQSESVYRHLQSHMPAFADVIASALHRPEIPIAATDQENVSLARLIDGSLTAAALAQVVTEAPDLTLVRLNGVRPSPERITDGTYPLTMPLFLVAPPEMSDAVRRIVEFARSPEGASILAELGQLPAGRTARSP